VRLHDAAETARLTGCKHYLGSWSHSDGGTVHPLKLVYGLARTAVLRGARIYTGSAVRSLTRETGRWRLTTSQGELIADKVLVCTNALSNGLFPRLAATVIPVTIVQAATEPIAPDDRRHLFGQGQCLSDTRTNLFTYRFDGAWRLISGALPVPWIGARSRVASHVASRLRSVLALRDKPRIAFSWCGRASVSRDFLPSLYEMEEGVLAGTGCNGRGIAVSAELGRAMAALVLGAAEANLPSRFGR
jgi:glycine/D-amino acid oxidase-like deaminating enzyme